MLAFASAIAVLITILIHKRNEEKDTESLATIKNQVMWGIRFGKILLIIYVVSIIGAIFIVPLDSFPRMEDAILISFFSIPVFCGIILVFAGDILRRACDAISYSSLPRRREVIDRPLKSDTPIERETSSEPSASISEIITQNADKLAGIELKEGAIIPD